MIETISSFLSHSRRSESGNASIEFAVMGPVLIALTLGVFELGRIAFTYHNLLSATGIATRMVAMGASLSLIHI